MANSTVTQRHSTNKEDNDELKYTASKPKFEISVNISFSSPFNIPSTLESAARRILRNLSTFLPFYVFFVWFVLVITLIPLRRFSLFLLLVNTNFTVMYLLVLRAFPKSLLLHQWIDKRLVFALLTTITAVEMIVSEAGLHLLFTLIGTVPVMLLHAVLQATEGFSVVEEQVGAANDHIAETV